MADFSSLSRLTSIDGWASAKVVGTAKVLLDEAPTPPTLRGSSLYRVDNCEGTWQSGESRAEFQIQKVVVESK